ncbi:glycosyl transferase, partial [Leptospira interrogans serovar Canicola]|nr:glycosyl transferase [Leptospira interrogans serovar Canicola]
VVSSIFLIVRFLFTAPFTLLSLFIFKLNHKF